MGKVIKGDKKKIERLGLGQFLASNGAIKEEMVNE
jgi:hypothetical protein